MQKLITICDYCGKEIEKVYTLLPVRISEEEGAYKMKPDYEPFDMCLDCIKANLMLIKPGPLQKKQQAAGADPEQQEAETEQKEDKTEQQAEEPEQKAKKTSDPKKKVDHGRIVALYTANPPRSIEWIADDCRCSQQTVINHLKQEGIYKTLQERREGKQEEEE